MTRPTGLNLGNLDMNKHGVALLKNLGVWYFVLELDVGDFVTAGHMEVV